MYAQQCVQLTGTNRPRAWFHHSFDRFRSGCSCSLWSSREVRFSSSARRFGRPSVCRNGSDNKVSVAIAEGSYPFPFRTRKSSPPAPMVLGTSVPGRVGRRRISHTEPRHWRGSVRFRPGSIRRDESGGDAAAAGRVGSRVQRRIAPTPRQPEAERPPFIATWQHAGSWRRPQRPQSRWQARPFAGPRTQHGPSARR